MLAKEKMMEFVDIVKKNKHWIALIIIIVYLIALGIKTATVVIAHLQK